jgi:UDP-galactopyranose mutase
MTSVDYLVVGSGLTGATLARLLADEGREVLVVDRRHHMGGNVHDEVHSSGIRIQKYGPHFFRTNSPAIWSFVQRFSTFYDFQARVLTHIDGKLEAWPVTEEYMQRTIGPDWSPAFQGTPQNFEEASLALMPRQIYEKFVQGYTAKQWGVDPRHLDAKLAGRFDVRRNNDTRLSRHQHQGLPSSGFAGLMSQLFRGIPVQLGVDYLKSRDEYTARKLLIFTGPIDEYYGYEFGKLAYRGQKRHTEFLPEVNQYQENCVVNFPSLSDGRLVRRMEWKHMHPLHEHPSLKGTVLTTETPTTPTNPNDFEYPFPDRANAELFQKYQQRSQSDEKVLFCGRLGEYRYLDMDQAIARAFTIAKRQLQLSVSEV